MAACEFYRDAGFAEDAVKWSIEMIELRYDSPSLWIVAGLSKNDDFETVIEYVKASLNELGFPHLKEQEALLNYRYFCVNQLARNENIAENLRILRDLDDLGEFAMLFWAWADFFHYNQTYTHYADGMNRENAEEFVVEKARIWLEQHQLPAECFMLFWKKPIHPYICLAEKLKSVSVRDSRTPTHKGEWS